MPKSLSTNTQELSVSLPSHLPNVRHILEGRIFPLFDGVLPPNTPRPFDCPPIPVSESLIRLCLPFWTRRLCCTALPFLIQVITDCCFGNHCTSAPNFNPITHSPHFCATSHLFTFSLSLVGAASTASHPRSGRSHSSPPSSCPPSPSSITPPLPVSSLGPF